MRSNITGESTILLHTSVTVPQQTYSKQEIVTLALGQQETRSIHLQRNVATAIGIVSADEWVGLGISRTPEKKREQNAVTKSTSR